MIHDCCGKVVRCKERGQTLYMGTKRGRDVGLVSKAVSGNERLLELLSAHGGDGPRDPIIEGDATYGGEIVSKTGEFRR